MKLDDATVLVCDCEGTMPLDGASLAHACGAESCSVSTFLCRDQINRVTDAAQAEGRLVIACTQEQAAFEEALQEASVEAMPTLVNIREAAGWSDDAKNATPKIAALITEAALETPISPSLEIISSGLCLVYGAGEVALEAARQLEGRLSVSLLFTDPEEILPLNMMDIMAARGRIVAARGHLGDFEINVDGYAALNPSSRDELRFGLASNGAAAKCDLILDISGGSPLFPAHERRDGYFRADPRDGVAIQKALFALSDMVGEFEKPRYVRFREELCAHSRSQVTGCRRCLDICPAAAITPNGDSVAIDPYLCGGCGGCNAVCPTQAASYDYPVDQFLLSRAQTLLRTYQSAGGAGAALLIHATEHGTGLIEALGRFGRGLPAHVLPFAVNQSTQVNAEFLLSAMAYGATQILVLISEKRRSEIDGLAQQTSLAEAILSGLGYPSGSIGVLVADDPDALASAVWDQRLTGISLNPSQFMPQPEKRTNLRLATTHLWEEAKSPVETVALPPGSAFGALDIDVDGCTLCLSCVGACPTNALSDNPDKPQLSFQEGACIQCGLCQNTCPESVITLKPQFTFGESVNNRVVVKEEEPFECVSCGKPFASRSTIEKMLETLGNKHWMFQGKGADRLKMCEDCRVEAVFNDEPQLASGQRPRPRTTEDYLAEREQGDGPSELN